MAASVASGSRCRSPSGERSGRYHASVSFQQSEMPTSFAHRGWTLVVSVSSEMDFCRRSWARKASKASGVSMRWVVKEYGVGSTE